MVDYFNYYINNPTRNVCGIFNVKCAITSTNDQEVPKR